MHELTYQSAAKLNLSPIDLKEILDEAVAHNSSQNITGCLIYHKDTFIQILQGEKKSILKLYNEIKKDSRHNLVKLVWEGPAEKVVFDGWHMAYYTTNEKTGKRELEAFEKNLLILSSFHNDDSVSIRMFWKQVKSLISLSPE